MTSEALLQRRKDAAGKLSLEELKKIVIGKTQLCTFCGRLDHSYEVCERRRRAVEELEKESEAAPKTGKNQPEIPIMIGETEVCSFCGRMDHRSGIHLTTKKLPKIDQKNSQMMTGAKRRELLQRRKDAAGKLSLEELKKTEKKKIVIGNTQLCTFCGRLDHSYEVCERRRWAVEELEKESEAAPKTGKNQPEIPIMIGETEVCSFCGRMDHRSGIHLTTKKLPKIDQKNSQMMTGAKRRELLQRRKDAAGKLSLKELKKTEKKKIVIGNTQLCTFCGRLDHSYEVCERRRRAVEELEKESEAAPNIGENKVCSFCGRLDHNLKNCLRRLEAVEELEKERILRDKFPFVAEIAARLNHHLRDVRVTLK